MGGKEAEFCFAIAVDCFDGVHDERVIARTPSLKKCLAYFRQSGANGNARHKHGYRGEQFWKFVVLDDHVNKYHSYGNPCKCGRSLQHYAVGIKRIAAVEGARYVIIEMQENNRPG